MKPDKALLCLVSILGVSTWRFGSIQAWSRSGDQQERDLLLHAGAELSACGANYRCLSFFGLRWLESKSEKGVLARLRARGLPVICSPDEKTLDENDHAASNIFGKRPEEKQRRLVLAFDRTYLSKSLQLIHGEETSMLVGGCHRPAHFELPSEAHLQLLQENGAPQFYAKDDVQRANEMESYLLWDPTKKTTAVVEVGCYPCHAAACIDRRFEHAMNGLTKNVRGKWETLARLGSVLDNLQSVRIILCDGAGAHEWAHQLLLGKPCSVPGEVLESVPFWQKLKNKDLPSAPFPILHRLVLVDNVSLHYVPGPAHLQKTLQGNSDQWLQRQCLASNLLTPVQPWTLGCGCFLQHLSDTTVWATTRRLYCHSAVLRYFSIFIFFQ